jgi:enamine deaminase RidA (YjgF/YER057c/UK114 family)
MKPHLPTLLLLATLAHPISAQYGGGGRRGGGMGGGGGFRPEAQPAPPLPGAVLDGPPDSATIREFLTTLSDSQAARYVQAYDSFMVATKPARDSADVATGKMNDRLGTGDRAAALFYAGRLQDIGRSLRDRQDKFDDGLRAFLTKDQLKAYRKWEDDAERAAQERNKEAGLKWQEMPAFGGRSAGTEERRSTITTTSAPTPPLGAQAVRVGRTVYVASQTAVDSAGTLVGGTDLRAQATQAFRNVTAVLKGAGAAPVEVVRLTIYVVNLDSTSAGVIREAGNGFFSGRTQPAVAIVGVQSLARPGLLVAVEATAVTGS